MAFGATTSTTSGGRPIMDVTCAVMACAIRARARRFSLSRFRNDYQPFGAGCGICRSERDHAALAHARNARHAVFDFVRVQIVSRMNDDVFHAAGNVNLAIGAVRAVAGVDPARGCTLRKQRRRSRFVPVITLRGGRSAKPQLSFHAVPGILPLLIRDAHFMPGKRNADGDE